MKPDKKALTERLKALAKSDPALTDLARKRMDEAVDVPEFVVPWEAFRALAEGVNLEQRYRKPFLDIWAAEKDDRDLGPLSIRMGVRKYEGGPLEISEEEKEAVGFYHAFCFVKV